MINVSELTTEMIIYASKKTFYDLIMQGLLPSINVFLNVSVTIFSLITILHCNFQYYIPSECGFSTKKSSESS